MKTMVKGTGTLSPTIRAWASLTDDPLLDMRQIAERLAVHVSTVRRWVTQKKLQPVHRIGGKLRARTSTALRFAGEDDHV